MASVCYRKRDIGSSRMVRVIRRCMEEGFTISFTIENGNVLETRELIPLPLNEDELTFNGSIFRGAAHDKIFLSGALTEVHVLV